MADLWKRILVPVDFSPESALAVSHAARLAGAGKGELVLVHVVPAVPAEMAQITGKDYVAGLVQDSEKSAFAQMEALVSKAGCSKEKTKFLVRSGEVSKALEKVISEQKPTLIIMGAHGTGQTHGLRLGTIANHVLLSAPCSVLLVRSPHGEKFDKILLAVEFDLPPDPLLTYAHAVASAEGGQLRVAHIFDVPSVGTNVPGGLEEFEKNYRELERKRLENYLKDAKAANLLETAVLAQGKRIPEAIVEQLAKTNSTLGILGTHGRGKVAEFFLGSVAKEVARLSPVSILAVRPVPEA